MAYFFGEQEEDLPNRPIDLIRYTIDKHAQGVNAGSKYQNIGQRFVQTENINVVSL